MISHIKVKNAYYLNNEWCQVLEKTSNPWMPDTVKICFSNGLTKTMRARTFREQATENRG